MGIKYNWYIRDAVKPAGLWQTPRRRMETAMKWKSGKKYTSTFERLQMATFRTARVPHQTEQLACKLNPDIFKLSRYLLVKDPDNGGSFFALILFGLGSSSWFITKRRFGTRYYSHHRVYYNICGSSCENSLFRLLRSVVTTAYLYQLDDSQRRGVINYRQLSWSIYSTT